MPAHVSLAFETPSGYIKSVSRDISNPYILVQEYKKVRFVKCRMLRQCFNLVLFGGVILKSTNASGTKFVQRAKTSNQVTQQPRTSVQDLSAIAISDLLEEVFLKTQSSSSTSERQLWLTSAREAVVAGGVDGEILAELFDHTGEEARHGVISRLMPQASVSDQVRLLKYLRLIYEDAGQKSHLPAVHRRPLQAGRSLQSQPQELSFSERWQSLTKLMLDGYDFNTPPNNCKVSVSINFFKIYSLDMKSSTLIFSAWFRTDWTDPRLSWNKADWDINYITLQSTPNSLEDTLVWLPDLELYNSEESIDRSFQSKKIQVYSDGFVLWSRPGLLKALCKYQGLYNFPFDTLTCRLEIGAWSLDGTVQDIVARSSDGGFTWEGEDESVSETSGSAFQDYTISAISVERKELFYPPYPEPFPELIYSISLQRSNKFYQWKLLIPQIAMAFLSFIPYYMNPDCGERLGFGITLILATLTVDVISIDLMPVCQEKLRMDWITQVSFAFCMISLLESALVLFLYYLEYETPWEIFPRWLRPGGVKRKLAEQKTLRSFRTSNCLEQTSKAERIMAEKSKSSSGESSRADVVVPAFDTEAIPPPPKGINEKRFSDNVWVEGGNLPGSVKDEPVHRSLNGGWVNDERSLINESAIMKLDLRVRNGLYRTAFYTLDENYSGRLEVDEISNFGHFMLGADWTEDLTREFLEVADVDNSGALSLNEFAEFCEKALLDQQSKDLVYLKQMIEGFLQMMKRRQEQITAMWHHHASCVDHFARILVPPFYMIFLMIVLSLDFEAVNTQKASRL